MPDFEPLRNGVRQAAVFDDENHAVRDVARGIHKFREVVVGLGAYRALRAMLENENGIGSRSLEKLFKISFLTHIDYHIFRVTDQYASRSSEFA